MEIKIKAILKNCSTYPHSKNDKKQNIEIEVDCLELYGYGEKIRHISGIADDLKTYHCWEHDDIEITEFNAT